MNKSSGTKNLHRKNKYSAAFKSVKKVFLGVVCALGIVCIALVSLKILIGNERRKAENEYEKANFLKITKLNDNAVHIEGRENGAYFNYVEDGKICEGVSVGGVDVSGKDYDEARTVLIESMDEILSGINMTVSVKNSFIVLTASDFDVTANINDVLYEALKIGRQSKNDYLRNYNDREQAKKGVNLEVEFHMNDAAVLELVDKIAESVYTVPTEPYITLIDRVSGANTTPNVSTSDIYDRISVATPDGEPVADIVFHKGHKGFILNRGDLLSKISEAFDNQDYNAALTVSPEEPEPTLKVEDMASSMRYITGFSTEYSDSGWRRCRNLQKGASMLNCMVMVPENEISFNEYLGPRSEADGWQLAHQIVGGNEYVDTPGGGLCQVSTTLYNALMQIDPAHLQIISRKHHSIPSDYIDLGLDATVSYPTPDLVWKCVGNSSLYLFARADSVKKIIYMCVYGSYPDDGCTYKMYSELISTKTPEPPIEIEEPLWPMGFGKMKIKPRNGYTVDVYRQKYDRDGNKLGEPVKLYRDIYASVRGEYHYGTGSPDLPKPDF